MPSSLLLLSMPSGAEFIWVIGIVFLIALIPAIFYILTLQNTLLVIRPENRRMSPGNAWLLLIPLFSSIYMIILAGNLSDSIRAELQSRGAPVVGRPTYQVGLAYGVLSLCSIIPVLGSLAGIAGFVCWIIHWVKVAEYKRLFESQPFAGEQSAIFGQQY